MCSSEGSGDEGISLDSLGGSPAIMRILTRGRQGSGRSEKGDGRTEPGDAGLRHFEDGGRGPRPGKTGSFQKLEPAGPDTPPRSSEGTSPATPEFRLLASRTCSQ